MTQLLLPFDSDTKINILEIRVEQAEESSEKVRRGMYAELNRIKKENYELKSRLDILEVHICKVK